MPRMSAWVLAVLAALGGVGSARAQLNSLPQIGAAPSQQQMPGLDVGKPLLMNVGTVFPKAVPAAGERVGKAPGQIGQVSPLASLPGAGLDINSVVGPLPPGTFAPAEKTLWNRFVDEFGTTLGLVRPEPRSPVWTPGISRRNREREQEKMAHWRRD